jgi:hypothetical protein
VNNKNSTNIETRIANRAKSIFAAFGTIVNDFYLEAGIYFVGVFNAVLVAWDIYTDLLASNQPLSYAITLAVIAFIAVEGLAVYLVGAAAKTNNGLLWFFSVIFAGFFTYAHYQEMTYRSGIIAQYITLAIPPFVVIGYWARTVKVEIENSQAQIVQQRDNEAARQRQLEDDARHQKQEEKAQKLAHKFEMDRIKLEQEQVQIMAQMEVQKSVQSGQGSGQMNQMNRQNDILEPANRVIKNKKMSRQNDLIGLIKINPNLGPTQLTKRLNELGHSTSISTVKRDIKQLNGKVK